MADVLFVGGEGEIISACDARQRTTRRKSPSVAAVNDGSERSLLWRLRFAENSPRDCFWLVHSRAGTRRSVQISPRKNQRAPRNGGRADLAGWQVPILNIARKYGENDTIPPILNS